MSAGRSRPGVARMTVRRFRTLSPAGLLNGRSPGCRTSSPDKVATPSCLPQTYSSPGVRRRSITSTHAPRYRYRGPGRSRRDRLAGSLRLLRLAFAEWFAVALVSARAPHPPRSGAARGASARPVEPLRNKIGAGARVFDRPCALRNVGKSPFPGHGEREG